MNRLMAVPFVAVLVGLVCPSVLLDGGPSYVVFVEENLGACIAVAGCWCVLLYWLTRRVADLALWRGSGRKLALHERSGATHGRA